MSTAYDRIHGNTFPGPNDRYNPSYPDPTYNQGVVEKYPSNPIYQDNYYQSSTEEYVEKFDHVGDFTPFYIVITICSIIGLVLFILNIALGCCSRYSEYWNDRHTGNRWIVSLWTATPHKQPALDYSTELQEITSQNQVVYHYPQEETQEFLELTSKRESEI